MNHDEPYYGKKVQKFSVVKKCPKCGQLSLAFRQSQICCENCGYMEKIHTVR